MPYHIVMMIILLYSSAILIETILRVSYLRLRLVEVRLPKSCSSLVKHLNIFHACLQIYGGPGSLSLISKYGPLFFKAEDPVDPSFLVMK